MKQKNRSRIGLIAVVVLLVLVGAVLLRDKGM